MRFADGEVVPSQTLRNEVGPLSPAARWRLGSDKDLNLSPLSACSLNNKDWKWCAFRCEGTAKMGGCTHNLCLPSRLRSSATLTSLPSLRRCLPTWGERLSSRDAGGSRASKRARPREIRISPRSSQPQEHAAHAFEPPRCLPARSQVEFALRSRTVLF